MATDFSRMLSLLRQEKNISQRKAAGELGISQALLSHYENGIREPGLAFVVKACNYYHVSSDYLLGRTLSRDGVIIDADEIYDASEEKGTLKGSIMATLQKKLIVNTTSALFDLLGKTDSREAISAAGNYLSTGLYQLLRLLYRRTGGNESIFALTIPDFNAGLTMADMALNQVRYAEALNECREENLPDLTAENLASVCPGLNQSIAQIVHTTDERCRRIK